MTLVGSLRCWSLNNPSYKPAAVCVYARSQFEITRLITSSSIHPPLTHSIDPPTLQLVIGSLWHGESCDGIRFTQTSSNLRLWIESQCPIENCWCWSKRDWVNLGSIQAVFVNRILIQKVFGKFERHSGDFKAKWYWENSAGVLPLLEMRL